MVQASTPKFKNDAGVPVIRIGVKEFECMGASPPYDHPHIFIDMGRDNEAICPYCSTLYKYDPTLGPDEAVPADAFFVEAREPVEA